MGWQYGSRYLAILVLTCLISILVWSPVPVQFISAFSDMTGRLLPDRDAGQTAGLPLQQCTVEQRLEHLHNRCLVRKNRTDSPFTQDPRFYWRLLVDDKHKALYCVIPKAACTTWKTTMVNLTGIPWNRAARMDVHNEGHLKDFNLRYLHHFSPEDAEYRLNNYFKFLIVRHPLDRIQSAFADKVLHNNYYQKSYDHIIKNYRRNPKEVAGGKISLEEFVTFIANDYPEYHDRHYMSYYDLCRPCDIKYDYIAKVETLTEDTTNLIKILQQDESADYRLQRLNARQQMDTTRLKVLSDYADLPANVMQLYYKKFSLDFDLFGYNFGVNNEVVCQSGDTSCC